MKYYLIIYALILGLLIAISPSRVYSAEIEFSSEEKAFIEKHPVINVGNELDWPPFDFNQYGKPKGLTIDFIRLLAKKTGLEINFVYGYSWSELLEKFRNKSLDVLPGLYKNEERKAFTLYTKPFQQGSLGVFVNSDNNTIQSTDDLVGKRVGIQSQFGAIGVLRSALPGIEFEERPETFTLVQMLSNNELDAIIGNPVLFSYIANYNQIVNTKFLTTLSLPKSDLEKLNLHVGVRKDWPILLQILDKAIDSVTDEEMLAIEKRWLFMEYDKNVSKSLSLTPSEVAYIESHPVIRVSNEMDYMPYDFSVGAEPRGFSIDLLNHLAKQAGLNIQYINGYTWAELVELFNNGELDLLHTLTMSEDRKQSGIFSDAFTSYHTHFFTRKGDKAISSVEDLSGKTVVTGKGWNSGFFLKKNYPKVKLLEVSNLEEMIYALSGGEADVMVSGDIATEFLLNRLGVHNVIKSGLFKDFNASNKMNFYFFAKKDSPELISILNKALRNISRKDLEDINNKWFNKIEPVDYEVKLTEEEKLFIAKHPTIYLLGGISFGPFAQYGKDGIVEGHDVDIANLISERTGLGINIELTNWIEAQEKAESKLVDGLICAISNNDREKYYNSSKQYIKLQPLVIVKKGNADNLNKISDLFGKRVAIQKGNLFRDLLEKEVQGVEIVYYDTIDDLIKAVVSGEVDFTILDETAFHVADRLGMARMIDASMVFGDPFELHFLIRKDWPEAVAIINKGLESITVSEKKSIRDKWFGDRSMPKSIERTVELTPEEQRYLDSKGSITYVVDPNWMPFESITSDGVHIGITADYIDIFSEKLGIPFVLKKTNTWIETLEAMKSRQSDIVSIAKETESRIKYMNFSEPFLSYPTVIVTRDDEFLVEDIGENLDKSFTVVSGYFLVENLKVKYPDIKIKEVEDIYHGLEMVRDGDAFAYIDTSVCVQYALSSEAIDGLKVSGTLPGESANTMGFRNDDPMLQSIMQKALASISQEEHKRILNKWMAVTVNKVIDYTLVWRVIAALLLVILATIIWNRKLRIANNKTKAAMDELRVAQVQLVQAEKMIALGQLVAGIAHEINTPLGAIKSSGENISYALDNAINNLPKVYEIINDEEKIAFMNLLDSSTNYNTVLTSREARRLIKPLIKELDSLKMINSRYFADIMLHMGVRSGVDRYLPILQHKKAEFIFETAYNVSSITINTNNIGNAVTRASKVIFALKSFSRRGEGGEMCEINLKDSIEAVLTLYQHLLKHGVELIRKYDDISTLMCCPDELGQVWTNLIHNALQAMDGVGTLSISVSENDRCAVVSISDTGCGIPVEIQSKLYDPFFTTKNAGEGTGLGLDIVKKIVEKHHGSIRFESELGVGTVFTVTLPYNFKDKDGTK